MLRSDIAISLIELVCLTLKLLSAMLMKSNLSKSVPIMSELYLFIFICCALYCSHRWLCNWVSDFTSLFIIEIQYSDTKTMVNSRSPPLLALETRSTPTTSSAVQAIPMITKFTHSKLFCGKLSILTATCVRPDSHPRCRSLLFAPFVSYFLIQLSWLTGRYFWSCTGYHIGLCISGHGRRDR